MKTKQFLFLFVTFLACAMNVFAQLVSLPYYCDFESKTENANWLLNAGNTAKFKNKWVINKPFITMDDDEILNAGVGIGPVDAAINALKTLDIFTDVDLIEYHVDAITGGTDAFIDVIIKLQKGDKVVSARGTEPDIINASVKAYISGVNRLLRD